MQARRRLPPRGMLPMHFTCRVYRKLPYMRKTYYIAFDATDMLLSLFTYHGQ